MRVPIRGSQEYKEEIERNRRSVERTTSIDRDIDIDMLLLHVASLHLHSLPPAEDLEAWVTLQKLILEYGSLFSCILPAPAYSSSPAVQVIRPRIEIVRSDSKREFVIRLHADVPLYWYVLIAQQDGHIYIPRAFMSTDERSVSRYCTPKDLQDSYLELGGITSGMVYCFASESKFLVESPSSMREVLTALCERLDIAITTQLHDIAFMEKQFELE